MNNAVSSQIFHVIIFYEPCKDSSSFINLNELLSSNGPHPQACSWSCFSFYMFELLIWPTSSFPLLHYFRRKELAKSSQRVACMLIFASQPTQPRITQSFVSYLFVQVRISVQCLLKQTNKQTKKLTLASSHARQKYRKILDGTADCGQNSTGRPYCPFYFLYLLHCGQGGKGGWLKSLTSWKY